MIKRTFLIIIILALILPGCVSIAKNPLSQHPKNIVSLPATVGLYIGGVIGMVPTIVLFPITLLIARHERKTSNLPLPSCSTPTTILMPMIITATGFEYLIGGPFWAIFGWWGKSEQY